MAMKTGVVFCCLLVIAGIVLCTGYLTPEEKLIILNAHNDIRSDVSPTAANMVKLVSHTHTHTHSHLFISIH